MNKYAIIMAGGNGTRLFPLSTKKKPKQFLNLYGTDCMINETIKRVEKIIPIENIIVVINKSQEELANKYMDKRIKKSNILLEPRANGTAICIAYAIIHIIKNYGESIMAIFSADHYITNTIEFKENIEKAIKEAESENLITIGIIPEKPSTNFGYIKFKKENNKNQIYKVSSFIEKPNLERAKKYVNDGYLWNSGMFIWNTTAILKSYEKFLPKIYKKIQSIINAKEYNKKLDSLYDTNENISIDVGIMEKANNVKVIMANFGWNDIGNIETLIEVYQKEKIKQDCFNNIISEKSNNVITLSEKANKKFIALGIEDIVIIDTDEICIVSNKNSLENIKQIREKIENS